MTDKELQKLKRIDLLEILIEQGKTIERLEKELEDTKKKLEERNLQIEEAGSIADAAIQMSGIFEAAQSAAHIYLENIQRMEQTTKEKCDEMERKTLERCQNMIVEAEKSANEKWITVSERLDEFYSSHCGLQEMLKVLGNFEKDDL